MDMDKNCYSDDSVSSSTSISNTQQHLKHLNKISHKISKPIRKPQPPTITTIFHNPPSPNNLQQQQQPPVYNINKNDFRDVVQKLTGSPAHERPPPVSQPRPPSSRLQRIRPPPLVQITNRPPSTVAQPFSPLPPLPAVHAAAESPISAYMRWNGQQQPPLAMASQLSFPTLPLPFGFVSSPRSPCALLSPNLRFLPTAQLGFPQLPLSPTLPVPSPRWKNI